MRGGRRNFSCDVGHVLYPRDADTAKSFTIDGARHSEQHRQAANLNSTELMVGFGPRPPKPQRKGIQIDKERAAKFAWRAILLGMVAIGAYLLFWPKPDPNVAFQLCVEQLQVARGLTDEYLAKDLAALKYIYSQCRDAR